MYKALWIIHPFQCSVPWAMYNVYLGADSSVTSTIVNQCISHGLLSLLLLTFFRPPVLKISSTVTTSGFYRARDLFTVLFYDALDFSLLWWSLYRLNTIFSTKQTSCEESEVSLNVGWLLVWSTVTAVVKLPALVVDL